MAKLRTAVIVLNYNTWKDTLNEVETIQKIINPQIDKIVIIDNNSPNESYENLKNANNNAYVLIKNSSNDGYAAGNNIGLKYAYKNGFNYAWIINNDIIIKDKNILEKMIGVMRKDPKVATVNPDIYAPSGYLYNRDSKRYSFWDMTLGMITYRNKGRKIIDQGGYGYIYRPQGCCMLLDVNIAHDVGYLDENNFLYCEEMIYAERLLKCGYRSACLITSSVVHNHSTTVKSTINKRKILNIKNNSYRYYLKEYRKYNELQIQLCMLFNILKQQLQ